MKSIGIVCEGERDYDMIVETVTCFTEQEFRFLWLQPNPEFGTDNGAGWKGVIRWCQKYSDCLYEYLNGLTPQIDLLIIQMDGDVARSEKEIYCWSVPDICDGQFKEDPLNCSIAKNDRCPQKLPPNSVCDSISNGYASYLENLLRNHIGTDKRIKSVITIPCDSTDTWILAAFEELDNPENICSPWDIIARKKDYHGIRIPGRKKSKRPYMQLINEVCKKWETVRKKCPQAMNFENDVKLLLT